MPPKANPVEMRSGPFLRRDDGKREADPTDVGSTARSRQGHNRVQTCTSVVSARGQASCCGPDVVSTPGIKRASRMKWWHWEALAHAWCLPSLSFVFSFSSHGEIFFTGYGQHDCRTLGESQRATCRVCHNPHILAAKPTPFNDDGTCWTARSKLEQHLKRVNENCATWLSNPVPAIWN